MKLTWKLMLLSLRRLVHTPKQSVVSAMLAAAPLLPSSKVSPLTVFTLPPPASSHAIPAYTNMAPDNVLFVANCGDCRAVVASSTGPGGKYQGDSSVLCHAMPTAACSHCSATNVFQPSPCLVTRPATTQVRLSWSRSDRQTPSPSALDAM